MVPPYEYVLFQSECEEFFIYEAEIVSTEGTALEGEGAQLAFPREMNVQCPFCKSFNGYQRGYVKTDDKGTELVEIPVTAVLESGKLLKIPGPDDVVYVHNLTEDAPELNPDEEVDEEKIKSSTQQERKEEETDIQTATEGEEGAEKETKETEEAPPVSEIELMLAEPVGKGKTKVMIVGVLDFIGSTNLYMARAFVEKGCTVIPFNYRTIRSQLGSNEAMEVALLDQVHDIKPDLVIICKGNGLTPTTVKWVNDVSPVWVWYMDPSTNTATPEVIEIAKVSRWSSCTGLGVAKLFTGQGVKRCYHIMEGIDPAVYHPIDTPLDINDPARCEVAFIGTNKNMRGTIMNQIYAGLTKRVHCYGEGWPEYMAYAPVYGEDFCRAVAGADIVVGWNEANDIEEYFSDRAFLTLACKGFHITAEIPGIEKYFVNEEELVWADGAQPFRIHEIVQHYTSRPEQRKEIAENGYKRVMKDYTWGASIEKILSVLKGDKVATAEAN